MKKDESSRKMPIPGNPDVVMPFMAWNEAFGVSIEKIDEQHKRLMSLMNYLNDAVDKGEEQGVLGKALSVLAGYLAHHCRAEENFFRQYAGNHWRIEHKSDYDMLTQYIIELRKDVVAGKILINREVTNSLKEELSRHILDSGKKSVECVNKCPASP